MLPSSSGIHLCSSHKAADNNNCSDPLTMDINQLIAHSTTHFGVSFMNNLHLNVSQNIAFSPWSMINLLGMILLGTVDKSRSQLEFYKTLGIPEEFGNRTHLQLHNTFKHILSALPNSSSKADSSVLFDQVNFILYNSLASNINQEYTKDLMSFYEAKVEDFRPGVQDPRGALHERVNSLVNRITRGMIKDLADPSLSSRTDLAMVLLNSAYFKGQWESPFKNTYKDTFFNSGKKDQQKEVDFMAQENYFRFKQFPELPSPDDIMNPMQTSEEAALASLINHLGCEVVELPYALNQGKEFSMLILLPNSLDGIEALQKKLNPQVLQAIYESLYSRKIEVILPKFNLETKYEPKDTLRELGLKSVFEESHDLARMFGGGSALKVDEIIHKTKINVDEKGSEAASASIAFISYTSLMYPQIFKANHPFLFIIRHNPSNTPLFMGRVSSFDV